MARNYNSEETRLAVKAKMKRLMEIKTPEERHQFSMRGVAARLAKTPPLSKETLKINRKAKRYAERKAAIDHYGGSCKCCGETVFGFLTIDHINGGGSAHRRSINRYQIYRWLRKQGYPSGFQILCYNCNCAKGMLGECPHVKLKASN